MKILESLWLTVLHNSGGMANCINCLPCICYSMTMLAPSKKLGVYVVFTVANENISMP